MLNQAVKQTSWGPVAKWYDDYLSQGHDSYQARVVWPNLKRLLQVKAGEAILDLACGNGYFSRLLVEEKAKVTGVDVSAELIKLARQQGPAAINYSVMSADHLGLIANGVYDKVVCVLALQNIEKVKETVGEVARVLRPGGKFYLVINHPTFRVPKASEWGYDDAKKIQYRRLDQYLSESRVAIEMNPGRRPSEPTQTTFSFHRPLQYYFKLLANAGFAVTHLEEWVSHKQSQAGPRTKAEDRARHEFPLFLFLQAGHVSRGEL